VANEPPRSELHERVTLNLSLSANRFRDGKLVEKHIPIVEAEKPLP